MIDERRMTYDSPVEPRPGDVLQTQRGRRWLVTSARKMRSKHPDRYALTIVKVRDVSPSARVLSLRWYPRGQVGQG